MDSAFFSDEIVSSSPQRRRRVHRSPFPSSGSRNSRRASRTRKRWQPISSDVVVLRGALEAQGLGRRFRFLFIRQHAHRQHKEPVQLDLFVPHEYGYDFKVIVTNKTTTAASVVAFHDGRGSQEAIFGDLKGDCQMDYVAVRRLHGNQTYLLAALFAHNLNRELQMITRAPERRTTAKRSALWAFQSLATVRRCFVQRAGRLTRPNGRLTLTMSASAEVQRDLLALLAALPDAA